MTCKSVDLLSSSLCDDLRRTSDDHLSHKNRPPQHVCGGGVRILAQNLYVFVVLHCQLGISPVVLSSALTELIGHRWSAVLS